MLKVWHAPSLNGMQSSILPFCIYLLAHFAIPRTGATSFSVGIAPILGDNTTNKAIYAILFLVCPTSLLSNLVS